ncbi:MAG TPA: ferredoxin [Acidimicrobiales bacterium]
MPDHREDPIVRVDRDLCTGTGMCTMYAPNTFAQDEENKAIVTARAGDRVEQVSIAVEACPTGALSFARNDKGV